MKGHDAHFAAPAAPVTSTHPRALPALREIARALSTAWDLDTTLDLIARKTTEVMRVDSCTIYLLDPDGQTLRLQASTGLAKRALGRATLRVGEGMTGYAVHHQMPSFASDAQTDPHFKWLDEAEEKDLRSLLAVPLIIESRPIGAMNVQNVEPHDFTPGEIEMLSLIADLAAGALTKAQLHDRQQRQLEELQALAEASEAVTAPRYLDEMLDVVTEMAAKMMSAAVCSIFLLDEKRAFLELRSAKRTTSPYRHRPPLPVGVGVIGSVVETGEPVWISDVRNDPRYVGAELARTEGLVSLLSVPLSVRDRVIGVFNCYTDQEREFSEQQRTWFLTLANQTALAIENARLMTNAAVVREMHHRIKNNLQTVAMLMRLQLAEASPDASQLLAASIHRVHSIAAIHEILSERGFSLVDLRAVLEKISRTTVEMMTAPQRNMSIAVVGESLLLPSRAASNLALIINELVQNALDHAFPEGGEGQIAISLGRAPEELVVLVRDNGVGFPGDRPRGFGLEIVETLVRDELRGNLAFKPLDTGTEVSIRLPRSLEHGLD